MAGIALPQVAVAQVRHTHHFQVNIGNIERAAALHLAYRMDADDVLLLEVTKSGRPTGIDDDIGCCRRINRPQLVVIALHRIADIGCGHNSQRAPGGM